MVSSRNDVEFPAAGGGFLPASLKIFEGNGRLNPQMTQADRSDSFDYHQVHLRRVRALVSRDFVFGGMIERLCCIGGGKFDDDGTRAENALRVAQRAIRGMLIGVRHFHVRDDATLRHCVLPHFDAPLAAALYVKRTSAM
jgi:hypothetical protein